MKIKLILLWSVVVMMTSCHSKFGSIPTDVTLHGLKGTPKSITEISFANDSLLKLDEPEASSRTMVFDKKGNLVQTFLYKNSVLDGFTKLEHPKKDTVIINSYTSDSTFLSLIKQWKTSDSTFELHEFYVEDSVILGEVMSIKTTLNSQNLPEKEEMTTSSGYKTVSEYIYSDYLLINQTQTSKLGWSVTLTYRYLRFDEYQNWIERQCIINEGCGSENVEYHIRTIEYFE